MTLDQHITWLGDQPPTGHWKWIYDADSDHLYAWHVGRSDGGPSHLEMLMTLEDGIDENLPLIDHEAQLIDHDLLCGSADHRVIYSLDLTYASEISERAQHAAEAAFTA